MFSEGPLLQFSWKFCPADNTHRMLIRYRVSIPKLRGSVYPSGNKLHCKKIILRLPKILLGTFGSLMTIFLLRWRVKCNYRRDIAHHQNVGGTPKIDIIAFDIAKAILMVTSYQLTSDMSNRTQ